MVGGESPSGNAACLSLLSATLHLDDTSERLQEGLPVLGLSQDEFDAKWRAFCRQHYGN